MSLSTAEVVERAVNLLEREGERGLGFNRLARELGVKPPSLYNHLGGDADLRRRVAIRAWARFDASLARRARGRSGEAALRNQAEAYRAFSTKHPGLFAVMAEVSLSPDDPDYVAVAAPLLDRALTPWRQLGLGSDEAIQAVRALRAAVHGFVVLERQGQFRIAPAADQTFARLVRAVIAGFGRSPA